MGKTIKKCTIVSGAPHPDVAYIQQALDTASYIIAADSGYLVLEQIGVKPDLIIADFDSAERPATDIPIMEFPVEKACTDTFNAVIAAVDKGFNDIVILNALGGRFDHSYSNLLCLDYCKKHGVKCAIQDRQNRLSLITEKAVIQKEYQWFSLFAFMEDCKGVRIEGAHYTQDFYQLDKMDIYLNDQFAQSNYVEGECCIITITSGTLLLIEAND